MRRTHFERALCAVAVVGALLVSAGGARGESPRAPGSNTGDASTPFTGLAQAPEANLFVGAATTSIPIELPPGRKNMTPKLALAYNSGGGPSPYGYGWDLPLGKIQRSTKHGVPLCRGSSPYQNDYTLELPGASLECTLDTTTNRCNPIIEDAYLRIQYFPSDDHWEVWDKSGIHYVFGKGGYHSRLPEPATVGCTTFSWALTHAEDPNGNHFDITYDNYDNILYPTAIFYGAPANSDVHTTLVSFNWDYDDLPATMQVVNANGGFPTKLDYVLHSIEVTNISDPSWPDIRSYEFLFDHQTATPRVGRRGFLQAVTLYDSNHQPLANISNLPAATTFLYHDNSPASGRFGFIGAPSGQGSGWDGSLLPPAPWPGPTFTLRSTDVFQGGGSDSTRDVMDMNGDGIPDLVTSSCTGPWIVRFGTKSGLSPNVTSWLAPAGVCNLRVIASQNQPQCGVSPSPKGTTTQYDTFDIDGDGIPDFIDASSMPWKVYRGSPNAGAGGQWGFLSWVPWTAPKAGMQRTARSHLGNIDGTGTQTQLRDMNGDGLPDLVEAGGSQVCAQRLCSASRTTCTTDSNCPGGEFCAYPWNVWLNTGSGFATTASLFPAPSNTFAFVNAPTGQTDPPGTAIGRVDTLLGTFDVNGDGLPDYVYPTSTQWNVWLNDGQGLTKGEVWSMPSFGAGGFSLKVANYYSSSNDTFRDFFDINGDGLPDVVDASVGCDGVGNCTTNWNVRLNQGNGFSDVIPWNAGFPNHTDFIRSEFCTAWGGVNADRCGRFETVIDTFDIDGDGLADHPAPSIGSDANCDFDPDTLVGSCWGQVVVNAGGAQAPGGGRPDLLESVENGIGGTTSLAYEPSTFWDNRDATGASRLPFALWTVTHIERDDALSGVSGGSHTLHADFTYAGGLFNGPSREFRGFATVSRFDAAGNVQQTAFHQDAVRKGKVQSVSTYEGGDPTRADRLRRQEVTTWLCTPFNGGATGCPDVLAAGKRELLRQRQVDRYDYDSSGANPKHAVAINLAWDAYGNVTELRKGGDGTSNVHTYADYLTVNSTSIYLVDRPWHSKTVSGNKLEEKWFLYDNLPVRQVGLKGNPTAVYAWLDTVPDSGLPAGVTCPTGTGTCALTGMTYDTYGNVTVVSDTNGNPTTTTYDALHLYPASVKNALNQTVFTHYDPACGKVLSQTDASNATTQYHYDSFCRLDAVTRPGDAAAERRYFYYLGDVGYATDIETLMAVGGDPSDPAHWTWARRDDLFDGLGRHVQNQRDGVREGSATLIVDGTTFDDRGNVGTRYAPSTPMPRQFSGANPNAVLYQTPTRVPTRYAYDALNRVIRTTNPDGTRQTADYGVPWQIATQDACLNAGSCPGSRTVEMRDAFGHVIEKDVYKGSSTFETRTGYTYDGLGRLVATTQGTTPTTWAANTTIALTYDSLGRKIRKVDPDSGTWTYGYDLVGNLVYQDDPKTFQHLEFQYDVFNRITRKYVYTTRDIVGAGGLYRSDGTTQAVYTYDHPACDAAQQPCPPYPNPQTAIGRLTRVTDASGSTTMAYDLRGRTQGVVTGVNAGGKTTYAQTASTYDIADHVAAIQYPDGEIVTYGFDGVGQVRSLCSNQQANCYVTNLTYDVFGRPRLLNHGNGTTDERNYYGSDQNFRLQMIRTTGPGGTLQDLSYGYQANGQLRTLVDGHYGAGDPLSDGVTYTYDGLGRLTIAGANAYGGGYAYDRLGNLTFKDGSTFVYGTSAHPHQPTAAGTLGGTLGYDTNGARTAKANQFYGYNVDNRLATVNVGTDAVTFLYDYTGRRAAKISNGNVTRYYGRLAETSGDKLTKYYYAAGMMVASQRATTAVCGGSSCLAAVPADPAIQLAGDMTGRRILLRVALRSDVAGAVASLAMVALLLLWAVPGRRTRVLGIAIYRGPVLALVALFTFASFPVSIVGVQPAWAGCSNCGGTTTTTLPPVLGSDATTGVLHYHLNHLGSPEIVTDGNGAVVKQIRYKAFGEVRLRADASGHQIPAPTYPYEFTGYETEPLSGLEYAGARFYDPSLGMFTTHDPAREFSNPYLYLGGDPLNGVDVNGEGFGVLIVAYIVGAIAAAVASGIQAAVNGASASQALEAAGNAAQTGGAMAAVSTVFLAAASLAITSVVASQLVNAGMAPATASTVATAAVNGSMLTAGAAQAGYEASQGDYTSLINFGVKFGLGLALGDEDGGQGAGKSSADPAAHPKTDSGFDDLLPNGKVGRTAFGKGNAAPQGEAMQLAEADAGAGEGSGFSWQRSLRTGFEIGHYSKMAFEAFKGELGGFRAVKAGARGGAAGLLVDAVADPKPTDNYDWMFDSSDVIKPGSQPPGSGFEVIKPGSLR